MVRTLYGFVWRSGLRTCSIADGGIIAQGSQRFHAQVVAAHGPLAVLLEHQRADKADDCRLVGENRVEVGASLHLAVARSECKFSNR